ncbi:MAG: anthrone oxygenase family protein [Geodermatophilaceae bacterium]
MFTAMAAVLHLGADDRSSLVWIVAALVLYGVMLALTFRVHLPLNNQIQAAGEPDHIADLAAVRENFESKWVRWNIARAASSTAAFGCLTWALTLVGGS